MLQPSTGGTVAGSTRDATRRRSVVGVLALAMIAASCGGSDPSQPIQSLQSAAETARLTVHERLDGAVSERYTAGMLDAVSSNLPELRSAIGRTPLRMELRLAGLIGVAQLTSIIDDARNPGASRAADAAQLDALAIGLARLARAAGAKEP